MNLKTSLTIICFAIFSASFAQQTGIQFQHINTWEQVLAKAKQENKLIFIDCYTSWCGPCKRMSNYIFPLQDVGDYYNQHFINVKLQMDTTDKDNENVVAMRGLADDIFYKYEIKAFPTLLFFNSNGELIHRMMGAKTKEEFIEGGQNAVDPNSQYFVLRDKYLAGERDMDFLRKFIIVAQANFDTLARKAYGEYYSRLKNVFTKEELTLMLTFTNSVNDKTFNVLYNNPEKIDKIMGKPVAHQKIVGILPADMIFDSVTKKPNWKAMTQKAMAKYPKYAEDLIYVSKNVYYLNNFDFKNYSQTIDAYVLKHKNKNNSDDLNHAAEMVIVFFKEPDKQMLTKALAWSKQTVIGQKPNPDYYKTYAYVLNSLNRNAEALNWANKALNLAKAKKMNTLVYEEAVKKIENKN